MQKKDEETYNKVLNDWFLDNEIDEEENEGALQEEAKKARERFDFLTQIKQ